MDGGRGAPGIRWGEMNPPAHDEPSSDRLSDSSSLTRLVIDGDDGSFKSGIDSGSDAPEFVNFNVSLLVGDPSSTRQSYESEPTKQNSRIMGKYLGFLSLDMNVFGPS